MENMENTDYNDDLTYPEYQPDGGSILYPVPSYWIEVEGIFPTVERGTTFYPHLMYYVPVYDYETLYNTVDYGYSLRDDLAPYENDSMLHEQDNTEHYSDESDEDWLATDTYHTSEVPDFYLEPEASNVGAEDLQQSDSDSSWSTIDSYQTEDRDSELCSTGTVSNIFKTSYKQIECSDFDSKNLNNSVEESFESSLNSNYESNDDNKWFACKDSGSISKEMSFDDIRLEDENNRATKNSDCSSNCINVSSKVNNNFVAQSPKSIYGKPSDEDIIVSHNDKFFQKQDLEGPRFESVKKNHIKKHRTRYSSKCKSENDSGERFFMKGFEFDCESKTWDYQRMKKIDSLDDLSETESTKKYNTSEDLSKTRSLKKKEDLSESSDDEKYKVQLLEEDFDYASVETKADSDEYEEKNCLLPPECIEFTDKEVKYMKDDLYLTALSGKLYKKTQIPPVEVLPIIYEEGEEPLCEGDDESRTVYKEIEEEFCEDNDESSTVYEEVVEQLCEGNEEYSELQTSAVGEAEGALTCSPDLSKSVKKQKSKGKRMKNIRKFFSRIFCCVKPP